MVKPPMVFVILELRPALDFFKNGSTPASVIFFFTLVGDRKDAGAFLCLFLFMLIKAYSLFFNFNV
jgi:hypothetical protein